MGSTHQPKALTWRVTDIPPGTTERELLRYFAEQDRVCLTIKSLCPDVEGVDQLTATALFRPDPSQPDARPRFDSFAPDELEVDKDFWGFTPLYCPPKDTSVSADIIAITGLAGHAFGSWAHSDQQIWLRDNLPKNAPNARILTYGYDTRITNKRRSAAILSDLSNSFFDALINMRHISNCEQRPIIFIGHSLGCLLIKKLMTSAKYQRGVDSSRLPVRAIIFLAAPHRGMNVDALRNLVGYPHEPPQQLIEELASGSPTLEEMNERFADIAKDIEILTCFETLKTKTVAYDEHAKQWTRSGPEIMMVEPYHTKQYYDKETVVNAEADHSGIAKMKKGPLLTSISMAIRRALTPTAEISRAGPQGGMQPEIPNGWYNQNTPSPYSDDKTQASRHSPSPGIRGHGFGQSRHQSHYDAPQMGHSGTQTDYESYFPSNQTTPPYGHQRQPWGAAYGGQVPGHPNVPHVSSEGRPSQNVYGDMGYQARYSNFGPPDARQPSAPPYPDAPPIIRAASVQPTNGIPRQSHDPFNPNPPYGYGAPDGMGGFLPVPGYPQGPSNGGLYRQPSMQQIHLASLNQGFEQMNIRSDDQYPPAGVPHMPANVPVEGVNVGQFGPSEPEYNQSKPDCGSASLNEQAEQDEDYNDEVNSEHTRSEQGSAETESVSDDSIDCGECSVCREALQHESYFLQCEECDDEKNEMVCRGCQNDSESCLLHREPVRKWRFVLHADASPTHDVWIDPQPTQADSALVRAVKNRDISRIGKLARNRSLLDQFDSEERTALHIAVNLGLEEEARVLISYGADMELSDDDELTPLGQAIQSGRPEMVRTLLEKGAKTDDLMENGQTPLHFACQCSSTEVTGVLLEYIRYVDKPDDEGDTALSYTCYDGNWDMADLLLDAGANPNICIGQEGGTLLGQLAENGNSDAVTFLLDRGASLESSDDSGRTVLYRAAEGNEGDLVKTLLERGAYPNTTTKDGEEIVLGKAAADGNEWAMIELLDGGADIDGEDSRSRTALFRAAEAGQTEVCRTLLERGATIATGLARPDDSDGHVMASLHVACWSGYTFTAEVLLDAGADVDVEDCCNRTPLYIAAEYGKLDTCKLLCNAGANTRILSTKGHNAVSIAASYGHMEVVRYLLEERGASGMPPPVVQAGKWKNFEFDSNVDSWRREVILKTLRDFKHS